MISLYVVPRQTPKKTCSCFSLQSLPAPVKRRLKALKKLQLEATKIEAKFYEEIHALECKYHELYSPLYTKRTKITKGEFSSRFKYMSAVLFL